MTRPRLISVDELRAAGALDVPPAWRKSLSRKRTDKRKERNLTLFGDDDALPEEQQPTSGEPDDTGATDDVP
ncbi:MAG TPA: hypothetical protein VGJ26_17345 [Pirellulales bacterium]|jgi:hypothetical protein